MDSSPLIDPQAFDILEEGVAAERIGNLLIGLVEFAPLYSFSPGVAFLRVVVEGQAYEDLRQLAFEESVLRACQGVSLCYSEHELEWAT